MRKGKLTKYKDCARFKFSKKPMGLIYNLAYITPLAEDWQKAFTPGKKNPNSDYQYKLMILCLN